MSNPFTLSFEKNHYSLFHVFHRQRKLLIISKLTSHLIRFVEAKIDFSILGLGVSLENAAPITDVENAIELMLAELQKKQKKILISIDEITDCEFVRVFASSFQIFLRQGYPILLLFRYSDIFVGKIWERGR